MRVARMAYAIVCGMLLALVSVSAATRASGSDGAATAGAGLQSIAQIIATEQLAGASGDGASDESGSIVKRVTRTVTGIVDAITSPQSAIGSFGGAALSADPEVLAAQADEREAHRAHVRRQRAAAQERWEARRPAADIPPATVTAAVADTPQLTPEAAAIVFARTHPNSDAVMSHSTSHTITVNVDGSSHAAAVAGVSKSMHLFSLAASRPIAPTPGTLYIPTPAGAASVAINPLSSIAQIPIACVLCINTTAGARAVWNISASVTVTPIGFAPYRAVAGVDFFPNPSPVTVWLNSDTWVVNATTNSTASSNADSVLGSLADGLIYFPVSIAPFVLPPDTFLYHPPSNATAAAIPGSGIQIERVRLGRTFQVSLSSIVYYSTATGAPYTPSPAPTTFVPLVSPVTIGPLSPTVGFDSGFLNVSDLARNVAVPVTCHYCWGLNVSLVLSTLSYTANGGADYVPLPSAPDPKGTNVLRWIFGVAPVNASAPNPDPSAGNITQYQMIQLLSHRSARAERFFFVAARNITALLPYGIELPASLAIAVVNIYPTFYCGVGGVIRNATRDRYFCPPPYSLALTPPVGSVLDEAQTAAHPSAWALPSSVLHGLSPAEYTSVRVATEDAEIAAAELAAAIALATATANNETAVRPLNCDIALQLFNASNYLYPPALNQSTAQYPNAPALAAICNFTALNDPNEPVARLDGWNVTDLCQLYQTCFTAAQATARFELCSNATAQVMQFCVCPYDEYGFRCAQSVPVSCQLTVAPQPVMTTRRHAASLCPPNLQKSVGGQPYEPALDGDPSCTTLDTVNDFAFSIDCHWTTAADIDLSGGHIVTPVTYPVPVEAPDVTPDASAGWQWDTNYAIFDYVALKYANMTNITRPLPESVAGKPLLAISAYSATPSVRMRWFNFNRLSDTNWAATLRPSNATISGTTLLPGNIWDWNGFPDRYWKGGRLYCELSFNTQFISGLSAFPIARAFVDRPTFNLPPPAPPGPLAPGYVFLIVLAVLLVCGAVAVGLYRTFGKTRRWLWCRPIVAAVEKYLTCCDDPHDTSSSTAAAAGTAAATGTASGRPSHDSAHDALAPAASTGYVPSDSTAPITPLASASPAVPLVGGPPPLELDSLR